MDGFPHIFSFYSFKGGVGRSMALLNVAYTLASRGRHVLIMDLDLEAPGLSGFLHREHELEQSAPEDIVDLLAWARRSAATLSEEKPQLAPSELPGGTQFITPVKPEKLSSLKPRLGDVGHLDVICANTDTSYYDRFTNLQLGTLQQNEIVAMGRLLRAWLKRLTVPIEVPDYYGPDIPRSVPYDYVLIDSRTGISEIGGLCIGPLSDRLVVLTALNDQNIEGTKRFLQEVGINKTRTSEDTPWDDVDVGPSTIAAPPRMGPKPTLLVASPVPAGGLGEKRERLEVLDKQIGPIASKISYHPQLALHETIFVRDWTDEYLAAEYSSLADHLMAMVADHGRQNIEVSPEMFDGKAGSPEKIIRAAMHLPDLATNLLEFWSRRAKPSSSAEFVSMDRVFRILTCDKPSRNHNAFNNWGNALLVQAQTKQGAEADQLFERAAEKYEAALRIESDMHQASSNWGLALSDQATMKQGAEADQLFERAAKKYEAALRIKPDQHEALYNWARASAAQAQMKQGAEADQLYQQAAEKYEAALRIEPDMHDAFNNWGNALLNQAKTKQGAEADQLCQRAVEKYEAALQIKPDKDDAFINWGNALLDQAKMKQGAEADQLRQRAVEKYEAALRIKPDAYEPFNNWGNALLAQARSKQGTEADQLYQQAGEKYATALRIKPDAYEPFNHWGNALWAQARTKQGAEADQLYQQAAEKYEAALRIKPDMHDAFNNWGNALLDQAKTKQNAEADQLYQQAAENYEAALRIKPDMPEAFSSWGTALINQAYTKEDPEARELLRRAHDKCSSAEKLCPGSGAYNLACISAMRGQVDDCRMWLQTARTHGKLPKRNHLMNDTDLTSVRDLDWFPSMLDD